MHDVAKSRMKPLSPDSLVEMAYASIRESILAGHFQEGEHIVESKVADELGISRAPVREALRRLGQEGLTVERPRRGTFVREVTAKDFIDIYNVRIAIETAAVRLAVRRDSSFADVEKAIQAMAKAAREQNVSKTIDLELRIHQQICEASGNEYLAEVFRSLSGPIRIALGIDDASFDKLEDMVETHRPLLDAMRSGDADKAVTAIQNHIIGTVGPVLERLGGTPSDLLARFSTSLDGNPALPQ
jgi:DNA-binding GntR family transcriptional regulator